MPDQIELTEMEEPAVRPPGKKALVTRPGHADQSRSDYLTPTIFHQDWWLEAATGGAYRQVEVESGGVTVGRLPFAVRRSFGMTTIGMPTLTHFLGPAIDYGPGGRTSRLLRGLSITGDLIAALPPASSIWIKLHQGIGDTIAFQEAGFGTEVQFTNEIEPAAEEVLWRQMRDKTRNVIRRAEEQVVISTENDIAKFLAFYLRNLKQRGLRCGYDMAIVGAIIEQSLRRGAGRILEATDQSGVCKAAIFTVWDRRSEYYLMSTRALESTNGAASALIWAAIKHAAQSQLIFDFDGARHGGDARFFAGFGGMPRARYWVWASKPGFRAISRIAAITRRARL